MVVRAPTFFIYKCNLTLSNILGARLVDLHHNPRCRCSVFICMHNEAKQIKYNVSYVQGVIKHWDKSWPLWTVINPIIACDIKLRDVISTQVLYLLVWPAHEASKTNCARKWYHFCCPFENVQVVLPILMKTSIFTARKEANPFNSALIVFFEYEKDERFVRTHCTLLSTAKPTSHP